MFINSNFNPDNTFSAEKMLQVYVIENVSSHLSPEKCFRLTDSHPLIEGSRAEPSVISGFRGVLPPRFTRNLIDKFDVFLKSSYF